MKRMHFAKVSVTRGIPSVMHSTVGISLSMEKDASFYGIVLLWMKVIASTGCAVIILVFKGSPMGCELPLSLENSSYFDKMPAHTAMGRMK